MYVPTPRGLNGYRGMGACSAVTGADGQQRVVCDTPISTDTVLPSGTNVIQDSSGNVVFTSPTVLGGLSMNMLLGIGAGLFGLLLVAKAGR